MGGVHPSRTWGEGRVGVGVGLVVGVGVRVRAKVGVGVGVSGRLQKLVVTPALTLTT